MGVAVNETGDKTVAIVADNYPNNSIVSHLHRDVDSVGAGVLHSIPKSFSSDLIREQLNRRWSVHFIYVGHDKDPRLRSKLTAEQLNRSTQPMSANWRCPKVPDKCPHSLARDLRSPNKFRYIDVEIEESTSGKVLPDDLPEQMDLEKRR